MDKFGMLIPVLSFVSVLCLGGAVISIVFSRKSALRNRLYPTEPDPAGAARLGTGKPGVLRMLNVLGAAVSSKEPSAGLRGRLARAGFHENSAVYVFMGAKLVLFVAGVLVFMPLSGTVDVAFAARVLMVIGAAAVLFYLPDIFVALRSRGRHAEVRRHLPDAIDLLEICVSSGQGLDMAWNAVTDEIRPVSTLLADEMTLTNLEINLGEERGSAIRHMAQRTGVAELSSLVAVLVQSEKFGTSVADALRVFATGMRELRSQRAEEQAEKMALKMIFPMVLFIFPVIIIVAVGPAALTLAEVFGGR
ncbi:MAG: type II secretion system F family protein [Candidatus Hydrogenedentes bacterium]|nr:type II secretion system F family protein [Candidatus Hydrogenedentota bacterium]